MSTTIQGTSFGAPMLPTDPIDLLECTGDVGAVVAALAVKQGEAQRQTAQTARQADMNLEEDEENQEVEEMRAKADDIRSAGWADGASMFAGGATEAVGACGSLDELSTSGNKEKAADLTQLGHGGGQLLGAFGKVTSAQYTADGANHDANATEHKAAADRAKGAADDMKDAMKAGDDQVSAAIDFYKQYSTTQAETKSSLSQALHRA